MRVSCWGGFYLGICLRICLFIFFLRGGGELGPCLRCVGVYMWLFVYNIPTLVLCFFVMLSVLF